MSCWDGDFYQVSLSVLRLLQCSKIFVRKKLVQHFALRLLITRFNLALCMYYGVSCFFNMLTIRVLGDVNEIPIDHFYWSTIEHLWHSWDVWSFWMSYILYKKQYILSNVINIVWDILENHISCKQTKRLLYLYIRFNIWIQQSREGVSPPQKF